MIAPYAAISGVGWRSEAVEHVSVFWGRLPDGVMDLLSASSLGVSVAFCHDAVVHYPRDIRQWTLVEYFLRTFDEVIFVFVSFLIIVIHI